MVLSCIGSLTEYEKYSRDRVHHIFVQIVADNGKVSLQPRRAIPKFETRERADDRCSDRRVREKKQQQRVSAALVRVELAATYCYYHSANDQDGYRYHRRQLVSVTADHHATNVGQAEEIQRENELDPIQPIESERRPFDC